MENLPEKKSHDNYIHIRWEDAKKKILKYNQESFRILGDPGDGKTTEMQEMYCKALKKQKTARVRFKFPIWIPLIKYNDKDLSNENPAKTIISEILNIEEEDADCLYNENRLCLFFDGMNEFTDQEKPKKNILFFIDETLKLTKNQIVVTDRSANPQIHYMENQPYYRLQPLNKDIVKAFINKYHLDDKKAIGQYFDNQSNTAWLETRRITPIFVIHLLDLIKNSIKKNTAPPTNDEDFSRSYLQLIVEREKDEKKDKRINTLISLLQEENMPEPISENDLIFEYRQNEMETKWCKITNEPISKAQEYIKLALELGILDWVDEKPRVFTFKDQNYAYIIDEIGTL